MFLYSAHMIHCSFFDCFGSTLESYTFSASHCLDSAIHHVAISQLAVALINAITYVMYIAQPLCLQNW